MKISDKVLKEVLRRKIAQVKVFPHSAQKEVANYMAREYNIKYGVVSDIFNGYIPVDSLDFEMLYKLVISIKTACKDRWEDLDLNDLYEDTYFTEIEKEKFNKPYVEDTFEKDVIFDEFVQINPNKITTKITASGIVNLRNIGKARYNPDTQRDLIEKTSSGVDYKIIDINQTAVYDMCILLLSGDFDCDNLTFNINTDINISSDMLPRIVNGKLIIPRNAVMDTLDGWHRLQAICLTKDLHPDWEATFGITIVTYSTEKANQFILLQDKKNHLSNKQVKRIDKNDEVNFLVNKLNESNKFHLKGSINNDLFYDLNNIITDLFNPQKREESMPLYKLIENRINEIIEENDWYSKQFSKEEWFIYLYCLKKSEQENSNFMNLLKNLDIDKLAKQIKYKNKLGKPQYKILDKTIGEVKINA